MTTNLAAFTATVAIVVLAIVAGAAPASAGARADYGAHVSGHARSDGGFSGVMNPGDHRRFVGFDEHQDR